MKKFYNFICSLGAAIFFGNFSGLLKKSIAIQKIIVYYMFVGGDLGHLVSLSGYEVVKSTKNSP